MASDGIKHGRVVSLADVVGDTSIRLSYVPNQLVGVHGSGRSYQWVGIVTACELQAADSKSPEIYSVKAINGESRSGRFPPEELIALDEWGRRVDGPTHLVRVRSLPGWDRELWVAADPDTASVARGADRNR